MGILRTDRIAGLGGANAITGSVEFTGNNDFLRTENLDDFYLDGNFTIEFWIKPNQKTSNYCLFTEGNNEKITYVASNTYFIMENDGSSLNIRTANGTVDWDVNAWHHVAFVRSGTTTSDIACYLNGVSLTLTSQANSGSAVWDGGSMKIGEGNPGDFSGYLSNVRFTKGTALYTANFTPPTTRLEKRSDTVLLCCNDPGNVLAESTGKRLSINRNGVNSTGPIASRFTPNSPVGFSTTSDVGSQYGSTFDGFGSFATSTYMVPPGGNTRERNRGRGLLMGGAVSPGATNTTQIKYFDIASQGITEDFGQTTSGRRAQGSVSSSTRGCVGGGFVAPTSPAHTVLNTIDFVTIANTANAIDFGDMQDTAYHYGTASNQTRGLFAGGYRPNNSAVVDTIDLITIATTGNASDFGNLVVARRSFGGLASPTRGIFMGGAPSTKDDIDFVTIASAGNATDFGNLTVGRDFVHGSSSSTRGVMAGGRTPSNSNVIDFITIASAGNATDFGDLLAAQGYYAATGNSTRALWVGDLSISNTIEYVTIATLGNSADWGDQGGTTQHSSGACSDSHGGLS